MRRRQMESGETGRRLSELIKKAIADCELTNSEHREILTLAGEDHVIDSQEQELLRQLNELLMNKTIKRIPD